MTERDGFQGVLFDFHSTLVDQGDSASWIALAWRHARRAGEAADVLGARTVGEVAAWLDRIWEHAGEIDPDSRRDLNPELHRDVYDRLVQAVPAVDAVLAHSLYVTMLATWVPYADAVPVLKGLRAAGIRTALVSNIGIDVRPVLERGGLSDLLDGVVLSYEVGAVKPDSAIFARALNLIGVRAEHALMVGDNWRDDAGAAQLGIRTLILPRTTGPTHGLDLVLRLIGD